VATHGNRSGAHGKEGVDGSSPSEGLQNPRSRGFSVQDDLLFVVRAVDMEPFMELSRSRVDLFLREEFDSQTGERSSTSTVTLTRESSGRQPVPALGFRLWA
jgi:hypothetical protein